MVGSGGREIEHFRKFWKVAKVSEIGRKHVLVMFEGGLGVG